MRGSEARVPGTAVAAAVPEREQQLEPLVPGRPAQVVGGLRVVRVRAGVEQQPREREAVAVRRRVALAAAERAGEGGERGWQPFPEVAGVRVRTGREQQARDFQRAVAGRPRVGEIEQRLPAVRTAVRVRAPRCRAEQLTRRFGVPGGSGGVQRGAAELRPLGEHRRRGGPARRVVARVRQGREPHELLGGIGCRGRPVRRAGVRADHVQVSPELRPAREAVGPCDRELGVREPQRGLGRRRVRVVLPQPPERLLVPRPGSLEQRLGLALEVLEAGILGKPRHWSPLHPRLPSADQAERVDRKIGVLRQAGCALPADRRRPERLRGR